GGVIVFDKSVTDTLYKIKISSRITFVILLILFAKYDDFAEYSMLNN
ncbi:33556_t:CDS:1, partial [Racocetra persica]